MLSAVSLWFEYLRRTASLKTCHFAKGVASSKNSVVLSCWLCFSNMRKLIFEWKKLKRKPYIQRFPICTELKSFWAGAHRRAHNGLGNEILGAPKSPNNVASTFFNTVHLLAGDAKLVSYPGHHLTSVGPWFWINLVAFNQSKINVQRWETILHTSFYLTVHNAKIICEKPGCLQPPWAVVLHHQGRTQQGGLGLNPSLLEFDI